MVTSLESMEQEHHYHQDHRDHLPLPVKQEASPLAALTTKNNKNSFPRAPHSSLKIHRESHTKTKSQHHKIASSSGATTGEAQDEEDEGPMIIFTLDPIVIHTKPEDFKDLVQKLTGMSRPRKAAPSDPLPKQDHNALSLLPEQNIVAFNPMGNTNTTTKNNLNNINMNMSNDYNYYDDNHYYYNYNYNNSSDEKVSTSAITDERYGYSYKGDIVGEPSFSLMPPLFDSATQGGYSYRGYIVGEPSFDIMPPLFDSATQGGYSYRGYIVGEPSFGIMPPLFDSATQGGTCAADFMPSTSNLIPYANEPFGYDFMNS